MIGDLQLQQNVIDELEFEPQVNAAHIGVTAQHGVVMLSGFVKCYAEKFAVEAAARRVKGVKAIASEIEVRLPNDKRRADDEIAERAVRMLHWDELVPDERVSVRVEKGMVTLNGTVDWQYQKSEAEYDIRKLSGVTAVFNLIEVRPLVRPSKIRQAIEGALERNLHGEVSRIGIEADGGSVTLKGKVHDWYERELIERAAWSVPGVTEVRDRLDFDFE
jgi:osmotically-inducible protein OsmY